MFAPCAVGRVHGPGDVIDVLERGLLGRPSVSHWKSPSSKHGYGLKTHLAPPRPLTGAAATSNIATRSSTDNARDG
jgi:hypothetical protein